ncbi:putative NBS resistance protein [Trifolium pratense]|uniref:Putative NBS resistance protein n=1 Tax=Trifolium pratense TaxID=57577 RepID=A0A2K3LWD9_TRIPR|nr:putative NBS resistance protein [Trifolium pratense]
MATLTPAIPPKPKTFEQALSNQEEASLFSPLPKPTFRGESICIKITQEQYQKGVDECKNHLIANLVDVDLSQRVFDDIMVERDRHSFYVDIKYEKLPEFCLHCQTICHAIHSCKKLHPQVQENNDIPQKVKRIAKSAGQPYHTCSKGAPPHMLL